MTLSMIAAIGRNRELGKDNDLLWNIPEDMKYFRDTTRGHTVVMGERTFHSLGRPLPNRTNIVLSQDPDFHPEGVVVVRSPKEALDASEQFTGYGEWGGENPLSSPGEISNSPGGRGDREVFVIGGGAIYSLFLEKSDRLYLTLIDAEFPDADVFFPPYEHIFSNVASRRESEDGKFRYTFVVLEKNNE